MDPETKGSSVLRAEERPCRGKGTQCPRSHSHANAHRSHKLTYLLKMTYSLPETARLVRKTSATPNGTSAGRRDKLHDTCINVAIPKCT